jgi:peptidoglycan/LPS O-acetylase OafA/YrhL
VEPDRAGVPAPGKPVLPGHLDCVDGLRGLAALIVVVHHCFTRSGNPELRLWHHVNVLRLVHDGWVGVNLFLVLSGFCLFWPYARNRARRLDFREFITRRALRIVPAYYLSLPFTSLIYVISTYGFHLAIKPSAYSAFPSGVGDVILHLAMLHSLTAATIQSWNSVTWSLGQEWTWYLVFPVMVWLFRRFGPVIAFATLAAVMIGYRVFLYAHFGHAANYPIHYELALRVFVLGRLYEFGAGMYVAWWLANREINRTLTMISLTALPILLIAGHLSTSTDAFLPIRDMTYGTAFACLVFATVSPHKSIVQRVVASKGMRSVGEYSYSLYLFHLPLVAAICAVLQTHGLKGYETFFVSLLLMPAILLFSRGVYLTVEKPFLGMRAKSARVSCNYCGAIRRQAGECCSQAVAIKS